ncbi:hypothetical protein Mp_3g24590 [Marchantia polymorpha subsp. ruderalis]|uniref:Uncharacterized protein n=2 Tax=Marchantia polymorpha TaxID=3197 RepID=A0AAF6B4E1_MARPO|nr:hypothetical protein MARPO_0224s0003 [Marchantia polymorpha]BBN06875.1 hypothetical protein Mp_3g24590 [Marchantia polymorpha subsp. ruderalis]|eukprot:PTQ27086.1 hypothetical protein MARPO_0224s0003 [Marchantia polymorpha]
MLPDHQRAVEKVDCCRRQFFECAVILQRMWILALRNHAAGCEGMIAPSVMIQVGKSAISYATQPRGSSCTCRRTTVHSFRSRRGDYTMVLIILNYDYPKGSDERFRVIRRSILRSENSDVSFVRS